MRICGSSSLFNVRSWVVIFAGVLAGISRFWCNGFEIPSGRNQLYNAKEERDFLASKQAMGAFRASKRPVTNSATAHARP